MGLSLISFHVPQLPLANFMYYRLNERASAALANAGKGQPSTLAGSSEWAESSEAHQSTNQSSGSKAFKSGHNEQHIRQSEDEFSAFLDGIDLLTSDPYVPRKACQLQALILLLAKV